jgi:GntR family transcriptional regulator
MDRLNPESPIPLYRQLADIIMARIRSGVYAPETRIPSEHRLVDAFGIGRPTVRQAIDMLVQKGLLIRKRGSGTFVNPVKEELDLFSLAGTTSAFHKKGIAVETQTLEPMRRRQISTIAENPFQGQWAYYCSRLSRVADKPVLIEEIYLHAEIFQGIEAFNLEGSSLSRIVEKHYYLRPVGGKQQFRIGYLKGEKADHLAVEQATPILVVNRSLDFVQAPGAVYAELYCRTDQYVFSQTIGGI